MQCTKTYLSGPMTGLPGLNFAVFTAEAERLRSLGISVVNPFENGMPVDSVWKEHMRADIRLLLDCDTIHMLPGWMRSRGALLEHHVATELGMVVTGAEA